MNFCSNCEISFVGKYADCPLCVANEEIEKLKQKVSLLESDLAS